MTRKNKTNRRTIPLLTERKYPTAVQVQVTLKSVQKTRLCAALLLLGLDLDRPFSYIVGLSFDQQRWQCKCNAVKSPPVRSLSVSRQCSRSTKTNQHPHPHEHKHEHITPPTVIQPRHSLPNRSARETDLQYTMPTFKGEKQNRILVDDIVDRRVPTVVRRQNRPNGYDTIRPDTFHAATWGRHPTLLGHTPSHSGEHELQVPPTQCSALRCTTNRHHMN